MDTKQDYRGLRAVVWGADNYNTLGLLRSLAVADLDITLIVTGSKQGVATASKYCKKYCYYQGFHFICVVAVDFLVL